MFPGSTLSDHVLRFNNIPQVYHVLHLLLSRDSCQKYNYYYECIILFMSFGSTLGLNFECMRLMQPYSSPIDSMHS